ncbi:MAG TPA: hypothetical protein VI793_14545 [Anaerolineales bacterium]|nr:hypothetical protein [Anaerolineales bacterium]
MPLIHDRETLVAALRERGVDWLAPSDAQGEPVPDETLIASLAAHDDARLRSTLTGLFLLNPELAASVPDVLVRLSGNRASAVVELVARYMAAVYLQNFWRTQLKLYLGDFPDLPDIYSARLDLPSAREGFGKPGLYALADWHRRQTPEAYNRLAEYHGVMTHVLASLKFQAHSYERAGAG